MNQAPLYYLLVFNILCVTYFLTSITMPDLQISDRLYASDTVNGVRFLWHQLALTSCEFYV